MDDFRKDLGFAIRQWGGGGSSLHRKRHSQVLVEQFLPESHPNIIYNVYISPIMDIAEYINRYQNVDMMIDEISGGCSSVPFPAALQNC